VDLALAAIDLGHGSIHHLAHHRAHVHAHAVTLDEGDDGLVGHIQRLVGVDGDVLASGWHLDVLVSGHVVKVSG
jgi:hypothetical protein